MSDAANAIYTGGEIVTVDDAAPTAEAVAVKHGRIVAVGDRKAVVQQHRGTATRMVSQAIPFWYSMSRYTGRC
jgi:predicted amidohydrolase YtcJ